MSIALHSAFYNAQGDVWQRLFGGSDTIALVSCLTYQSGSSRVQARSLQDTRECASNRDHHLGLSRLVALKVPATADGIELSVSITGIKQDNLQVALDLLNDDEFKPILSLSPISVGQITAVTGMVKKVFSSSKTTPFLEATYAGIISNHRSDDPVAQERLTAGALVMVSSQDAQSSSLSDLDPGEMQIFGNRLKCRGEPVRQTHVIFSITFEERRGITSESGWNQKYKDAIQQLDELYIVGKEEYPTVLARAKRLWLEGNALLDDDPLYIPEERKDIKATVFQRIGDVYSEVVEAASPSKFFRALGPLDPEELDFLDSAESQASSIVAESQRRAQAYNEALQGLGLVAAFD